MSLPFGKHIPENEVLAIDGKTIRGSEYAPADEDKMAHKAAHVVSAWAHSLGVCFGQVKTEEKSNEITAIPELLDLLDLKGMIVTIDAMGCQKKIVEKIAEKEAEYVISLKGNQQSKHNDVKEFFDFENAHQTQPLINTAGGYFYRFENISLKLQGTAILQNTTITLPISECCCFAGLSGQGKSSIVNMLTSL